MCLLYFPYCISNHDTPTEGLFVFQEIRFVKKRSNGCSAELGLSRLPAQNTICTVISTPYKTEVGHVSTAKVAAQGSLERQVT